MMLSIFSNTSSLNRDIALRAREKNMTELGMGLIV
jgi:hypothetical protein